MRLIDLHCDTLYKSVSMDIPLDDNSMQVRPISEGENCHKLQCYAVWLPDDLSGDRAEALFYCAYKKFVNEAKRLNIKLIGKNEPFADSFKKYNNTAYFTVENGSALNGKIENISKFADLGVKIITLTWNGSNALGDGAKIENAKGLTDFGKRAVTEMEKQGVLVDISHASDKLFFDVIEISKNPIIATHSNSRKITDNSRNLTDEQIKIIIQKNGLIGLNFHADFLNKNPQSASKYDLLRHTENFLSLGAENILCFGTDFDGCTLPSDIKNSQSMEDIYEMFLKHNYKESVINKIFYKNAQKFFENFDIQRIM